MVSQNHISVEAEPTRSRALLSRVTARISSSANRSAALPLAAVVLAAATFIVDTITDYEIAAATFYVVVVLLSVRFCRMRGVIMVSAACIALTIVSYALTEDGNFKTGIINTSISLIAIAATTYLAARMEAARAMAEQARAHLAHVVRVTTLGELAASIAHEVNQPLAGIIANANACTRWMHAEPPNLEKTAASVDNIVEDANRASEIIIRIRGLVTRAEPKKAWIEINGVIEEVLALMATQLRENRISLRVNLSADLPLIFGDRIQLQQVILNLAVNAIDAINAVPDGSREIRIISSKSDVHNVKIAIVDSGIGINPAAADRLFDAFHSTKKDGMGMGLSICRSIIEAHSGRICATLNEAGGATFEITLPGDREARG